MQAFDRRSPLLLLGIAFTISGGAGLIYESVWTRYLGLLVGHTAYAQVIVLATFLGGMSVGAWLAAERTARIRDPLRAYAYIEIGLGLLGLTFHASYNLATAWAYESLFPVLGGGEALLVARWALAVALILPQSILLGTTFPLMSAGVLRRLPERPGRILSILYFANSIGAAVAVLIAGFYLLEAVGLPGTLTAAAALNLLAGLMVLVTIGLGQPDSTRTPEGAMSEATPAAARVAPRIPSRALLIVAFGTAAASFAYEIAWIRMLSLVLGSATHAFELMLSAFILGLALGALWVQSRADRIAEPVFFLGVVQAVMGIAALATLPAYAASFGWMSWLLSALAPSDAGYTMYNLSRYALCLIVMIPPTFCAGIVLPMLTRTLLAAGAGEKAIGRVYSINTIGSIVGIVTAALVLMPWVGSKALLISGASLDAALGVFLLLIARVSVRRRLFGGALAAALAGGTVVVVGAGFRVDPQRLVSGVFRTGSDAPSSERSVLYYREGRTASVSVVRAKAPFDGLILATNGKPDASLRVDWLEDQPANAAIRSVGGDESTQLLLAMIGRAYVPNARKAAVVGQGSGMTSHFMLSGPALERLDTIEIEPEMVEGSRFFYPANRRVFDDPRSNLVIDDARSFIAASPDRYDVIASEPSNPWVSGVASLFTTEFYALIRRALAPNGVFTQWIQLYEIHDGLVLSVLAAIHENFPSFEIYLMNDSDMLIVAGAEVELPPPDWTVFKDANDGDLDRFVPFTAESLDALRVIGRDDLTPVLQSWRQPNSDFFPLLDLQAERSRFQRRLAIGFIGLAGDRFPVAPRAAPSNLGFDPAYRSPIMDQPRLRNATFAAALRGASSVRNPTDAEALGPQVRYLYWRWEKLVERGEPPVDWGSWLSDTVLIEQHLHGAAAGVVDEAFYSKVTRYLEQTSAPEAVRSGIAFVHALALNDMVSAARASEPLLKAAQAGKPVLGASVLLDGAIRAKIATGDVTAAAQIFRDLAPASGRSMDDVRMRMLAAATGAGDEPAIALGLPQDLAK